MNDRLKDILRIVPDFPTKGIMFYDVSTLFADPECLSEAVERLYRMYKDEGVTKVVGIESRGFVLGAALAVRLGAGLVMARKPGKLPADVVSATYEKEYGTDTIEIHSDAITPDDVVLLHDDILATGGTMLAAKQLVDSFHPRKVMVNFMIELHCEGLHGRDVFPEGTDLRALLDLG